ncbi:unnamed protein product [Adineta steineri]|uniref:Uncharacterized protein n=1 Tax=Adineta steineri TaxID=433720 RepID=A0A819DV43_9BILA|nr:unnamed protein product [Adineta steineri]CAF3839715.1 unnamed protein product [Adineta steineri]
MSATITYSPTTTVMSDPTNDQSSRSPPYDTLVRNAHDLNQEPSQRQLVSRNNNLDEIETYMCWSIFNTLCCCICLGYIACCFSGTVEDLLEEGNIQGALRASKVARKMNILATFVGIFIIIVYIFYQTIVLYS